MNLLYLNTNLQFTLIYENDAHYKKLKTITGKKNITNSTATNYPDVTTVTGEPLLLRGSTGSLAGIYLKVMQLFLDKLSNEVLQSKNIVETSGPS